MNKDFADRLPSLLLILFMIVILFNIVLCKPSYMGAQHPIKLTEIYTK